MAVLTDQLGVQTWLLVQDYTENRILNVSCYILKVKSKENIQPRRPSDLISFRWVIYHIERLLVEVG